MPTALDKYCYYVLSGWVYREAADDVASVSVRDGMWELDFSGEDGVGQWKYFMLDFANYNEAAVTAGLPHRPSPALCGSTAWR